MSRQHSIPFVIKDSVTRALESAQLPFDEAWLQNFIFENYQALPIEEIEPAFGPLIPICRELQTKVGRADNLFINADGLLTVVECKLWRNPEARRKVVAQILDYAKEISRWSYDDLQQAVSDKIGRPLYELVSENSEELDQIRFIDSVSRYLKRGHFLLLIVGDGIREDVELISEFLQKHAHLNFTFALVEMSVFRLPEEVGTGYLVHPRVIARTVEIERAVIRIEDGQVFAVSPLEQMATPSLSFSAPAKTGTKRTTISEHVFYETLDVDKFTSDALRDFFAQAQTIGVEPKPGRNSMMLKFKAGDKEFNFGIFNRDGTFENCGIAKSTADIGHPEIGDEYLEELGAIFNGYVHRSSSRFQWTVKKTNRQRLNIAECLSVKDKWLEIMRRTADKILEVQE